MTRYPHNPATADKLSPTKKAALTECLIGGEMRKASGFWFAEGRVTRISGVTVSDLARDGLLMIKGTSSKSRETAILTARGAEFAKTLAGEGK